MTFDQIHIYQGNTPGHDRWPLLFRDPVLVLGRNDVLCREYRQQYNGASEVGSQANPPWSTAANPPLSP